MKYKKLKKIKTSLSQSAQLLTWLDQKAFPAMINTLQKKQSFTTAERYLYGYALLQQHQYLKTLIIWRPLMGGNKQSVIQEDYGFVANTVFQDIEALKTVPLAEQELYMLVNIVAKLDQQSAAYSILLHRLSTELWEKQAYDKLSQLLKSHKHTFSHHTLENLSKLDYLQAQNKCLSHPQAFVGHVLTGGACLILRNESYHQDMERAVQLLAHEIQHVYYQTLDATKTNRQKSPWSMQVLAQFTDYEAWILTHVLQVVLKYGQRFSIIPTPSYFMIYNPSTHRVSEDFLSWLITKNPDLASLYDKTLYGMVFWALSGITLTAKQPIAKQIKAVGSLDPYIRLAIILRLTKRGDDKDDDKISLADFEKHEACSALYRKIAIKTVTTLLTQHSDRPIDFNADFWKILFECYPVIKTDYLGTLLTKTLLNCLHHQHKKGQDLMLEAMDAWFHRIDHPVLANRLETLRRYQRQGLSLLSATDTKAGINKTIKKINNTTDLQQALILIAETCYLLYPNLSLSMFMYLKAIMNHDRLNRLLPLQESLDFNFSCQCVDCREHLFKQQIFACLRCLKLEILPLPDVNHYIDPNDTNMPTFQKSQLATTNPFKKMDAPVHATKQEIIKKMMALISQQPNNMAAIRQAQSELFDPAKRFVHHYLNFLAYDDRAKPHQEPIETTVNVSLINAIPIRYELAHEKN